MSGPGADQPSARTGASARTSGSPAREAGRAGPAGKRPSRAPFASSSRHCRGESVAGSPGSRSEAGATSVSIVTPPASGRAASPWGSRAVRRGRVGSIAAPSCPVGVAETQSTGTPPRRPTCTSGRPADERTSMRTTSAWLRRKRRRALSAAWRSSEAAEGSFPASSSRAIVGEAPRKARSDAHLREPPLERRGLGPDVERERAPRLVEGALARDVDPPQARQVDRGHGRERDSREPAGRGAQGLHVRTGSGRRDPRRSRCCRRGWPGRAPICRRTARRSGRPRRSCRTTPRTRRCPRRSTGR